MYFLFKTNSIFTIQPDIRLSGQPDILYPAKLLDGYPAKLLDGYPAKSVSGTVLPDDLPDLLRHPGGEVVPVLPRLLITFPTLKREAFICEPANPGQGEVIIEQVPRSSGCVSNNLTQREPYKSASISPMTITLLLEHW